MAGEHLVKSEFKELCENYQFSCDELKNYGNMEKTMMEFYLDKKRIEGDKREKNQIYIEWIKIYSEFFRIMYMMLIHNAHNGCIDYN
jgi:hypothetical protein